MNDARQGADQPTPSRRERQAAQTRQEILGAARRLFVEKGYTATTISDIASEADVAVQTIYSSVGSKSELLIRLMEGARQSAEIPQMDAQRDETDDPLEIPRIAARIHRQMMEQSGDVLRLLKEASLVDDDVRLVWHRAMLGSHHGASRAMARLAELGALAPWVDPDRAGDVAFVLNGFSGYIELLELGWTHDEIEEWLVDVLTRQLVDPAVVGGQRAD